MNRRRFLSNSIVLPAAASASTRPTGQGTGGKGASGTGTKGLMSIAVGGDHAGFSLKGPVIQLLRSWKYTVKDCGSYTPEPVDFPDIAVLVCNEIKSGRAERGVMVCGTGVGAAIACNKIRGIRAALCHDTYSAHQCVEHDNVNVICLGAQVIGSSLAEEILSAFLHARFSTDEQFRRRVKKLEQLEAQASKNS